MTASHNLHSGFEHAQCILPSPLPSKFESKLCSNTPAETCCVRVRMCVRKQKQHILLWNAHAFPPLICRWFAISHLYHSSRMDSCSRLVDVWILPERFPNMCHSSCLLFRCVSTDPETRVLCVCPVSSANPVVFLWSITPAGPMFEPTLKPATSDYCRYGLLCSFFVQDLTHTQPSVIVQKVEQ